MERVDLLFKAVLTVIGTIYSIFVDIFGLFFVVLFIMQAADYITGIIAGLVTKSLRSSIGFKGLSKKIYVLILVGVVYLLEINLFGTNHLGDGICVAYIVMELISITENGGRMGAPIPPQISKFIEMLNGKGDKEVEKQ